MILELLGKYIRAEIAMIGEYSGNFYRDYLVLRDEVQPYLEGVDPSDYPEEYRYLLDRIEFLRKYEEE